MLRILFIRVHWHTATCAGKTGTVKAKSMYRCYLYKKLETGRPRNRRSLWENNPIPTIPVERMAHRKSNKRIVVLTAGNRRIRPEVRTSSPNCDVEQKNEKQAFWIIGNPYYF